jgi:acetyltransferase-like isoleucine patch superfamily enzyme/acyl carrier protein
MELDQVTVRHDLKGLGYAAATLDQTRSPLAKYRELVIGDQRFWSLLKYEALMVGVSRVPGLLGLALRRALYPALFKEMSSGVVIGQGVTIRQPGKISIGSNALLDDYCSLIVNGSDKAGIQIGNNVFIGRNSVVTAREGKIEIQEFANIGAFCRIASIGRTRIGTNVGIAAYCYIGMPNHKTESFSKPIIFQEMDNRGGVTIGNDAWIGAGSKIHDGVKIGAGAIVAAGSIVHRDIPDFCIAAGNPARVISKREFVAENHDHLNVPNAAYDGRPDDIKELYCLDPANVQGKNGLAANGATIVERATHALFCAIDEVNQQLPTDKRLDKSERTVIFDGPGGKGGGLDSLGLLNLIVTAEQKIEEEFGCSINIADDGAMSQKNSPFKNLGTLARYVSSIVESKVNG